MFRKIVLLMLSLCLVTSAWAYDKRRNKQQASNAVSVSDVNTTITLTDPALDVAIYNAGANEIFVDIFDGVATSSDIRIDAGQTYTFSDVATNSIGLICSTGETSTARVAVLEEDL